jgi:hypothetical protein
VTDFRDWPYSSYHALVETAPTPLQRKTVLGWFQGRKQFISAHGQDIAALASEDFD